MTDVEDLENIDTESQLVHEKDTVISKLSNGLEIAIMDDGNETDISKNIPNVVQTVYDIEESTPVPAQVTIPEVSENSGTVSENSSAVIESTKDFENKSTISLTSNWKRHAKQGNTEGGGQSLLNDTNKLSVVKTEDISKSGRRESLSVPHLADSKLLNDSRRESNVSNVKEGSKISLLSSVSQRSMQMKTDFTTIQMPADDKRSVPTYEDSWIRVAIPYLPLWLAVVCLILNILIPGSGTIVSGLCIFWCAKSRVPPKYDQDPILISCVNLWVGLAQLFTVTFLLVGWFWSIVWGLRMVFLSLEHRRELREQRATQLKQQAINAFGTLGNRRT